LDIYVGALTLYYAGKWENAGQRWARKHGATYDIIRPESVDDPPDPKDVRTVVVAWRDALAEAVRDRSAGSLTWDETSLTYASERPGWDGFTSLVLWAAYAEHPELDRPLRAVEEYQRDPAYLRSTAEGTRSRYSHVIRDIEFWLPWPFDGTLVASDPLGNKVGIGSSVILARQLRDLNRATWNVDDATLEQWREDVPEKGSPFDALARFGFATVIDPAQGAADICLPMKLDY